MTQLMETHGLDSEAVGFWPVSRGTVVSVDNKPFLFLMGVSDATADILV